MLAFFYGWGRLISPAKAGAQALVQERMRRNGEVSMNASIQRSCLHSRYYFIACLAFGLLGCSAKDSKPGVSINSVDASTSDTLGAADAVTGDVATDASAGADAGVACDVNADCLRVGGFCDNAVCTAPQPCSTDKVCATLSGVCAKNIGVCVSCAADTDCASDKTCKAYRCLTQPAPCVSSKDCAANNQVCDKTLSGCVGCETATDCGDGMGCFETVCVQPLCTAADNLCLSDSSARRCKSDGLGFETIDCAAKQRCHAGSCQDLVCAPATKRCAAAGQGGNSVVGVQVCDALGLAWSAPTACTGAEVCVAGQCTAAVCTPGAGACIGGAASACAADGGGWNKQVCAPGTSCKSGATGATCAKQICTPGVATCENNAVSSCATDGLSIGVTDDCNQLALGGEKRICVAGTCVLATCKSGETSCAPGGELLTCQANGSDWKSSACGLGQTCAGGSCTAQVCTPGSSKCGGNTALVCNAQGTDYEIGADCSKQGDACGAGLCKAGKCAVAPTDCDDSNPCTKDGCDATGGCSHKDLDAVACGAGKTCISGVCKAQVCKPGHTICQAQVVATCNANGTAYVAGADCLAGGGTCGAGSCQQGVCVVATAGCDDGNTCTVDGCDAVQGCTHKKLDGVPCEDGDGCTVADQCVVGVCQAGKAKKCVGDTCKAGKCVAPEIVSLSMALYVDNASPQTCVVAKSGHVFCWGAAKLLPGVKDDTTPIEIGNVSDAVEVSVGPYAACARRKAGKIVCWGNNSGASLGGLMPDVPAASWGEAVALPKQTFVAAYVKSGWRAGYAIDSKGEGWSWGASKLRAAKEEKIPDFPYTSPMSAVTGPLKSIFQQQSAALVLTESGLVWGFGVNNYGQLGLASSGFHFQKPVLVRSDVVALGGGICPCGLLKDGTASCWGVNQTKQFISVVGNKDIAAVVTPDVYGTRCLQYVDGTVECAGSGAAGSGSANLAPAPVVGKVTKLVAAKDRVCALMVSGEVSCWGKAKSPTW